MAVTALAVRSRSIQQSSIQMYLTGGPDWDHQRNDGHVCTPAGSST